MDKKKLCLQETETHRKQVDKLIHQCIKDLNERGLFHDHSKTEQPELDIFVEYTPKLKHSTYGSDEYKGFLKEMSVALKHHYAKNSHHPEFYEKGVLGMNLLDLLEMLCDWKAATLRHNDGDIRRSLDINSERFKISDDLKQILTNTVNYLEM